MFQHQHPIRRCYCNRAAGTSLTDNYGDNRYFYLQTFLNGRSNCFSLPACFRIYPRICSRRIDKTDNRQVKLVCQSHHTLRFAVPFRFCHTEIIFDTGFKVVSFFLPHNNYSITVNLADTAYHRLIIGKTAITGQRCKIFNKSLYIIQTVRSCRMSGYLRFLPG